MSPDAVVPAAPVSPTGQAIIPPKAVPYLSAVVAIVVLVGGEFTDEVPALARVVRIVTGIALLLGIASPGLRRAS